MSEPAISVRGAVKHYGAIAAVDGLDLEVPTGVCFGLLGPNGAGKSTTMRMLTAQSLADRGEITVLGHRLPRDSKQARMEMGVVPQLDNLDIELTCRQTLTVFARLYRVPRSERRAAVDRALGIANLEPRADTRVDKLSGGMRRRLLVARGLIHQPRLLLLDEPTVGLDPQIRQELWTLIDGLRHEGVTMLMSTHYIEEAERLADIVAVMSAGRVIAQGTPAELTLAHAGERVVEVFGAPARLEEVTQLAAAPRLAEPAQRARGRGDARGAAQRRAARRRGASGEPRGRLRGADRRGDRVSPREVRVRAVGRLEPAALLGVMSRDVTLFGRYWKATTFSSVVQPTIYLLAFAAGIGALVPRVGHVSYTDYIATGVVATAVLFSSAFPGMFNTFVRWRFQRTYDAMLATPIDVEELVTAEVLWIAIRAGVYGLAPILVGIVFGLTPTPGMLLVVPIGFVTGFGFAAFGVLLAAIARTIDNFNYITSAVLTPMFLVAGTFFPVSSPARRHSLGRAGQPALPLRPARPRRLALGPARRGSRTPGGPRRVRHPDVAPGDLAAAEPADRLTRRRASAPRARHGPK